MRTRLLLVPLLLALGAALGTAQPREQPAKPTALAVVPTDSAAFVSVNVGKMWDDPTFKPVRDWFTAQKVTPVDELIGLPAADVDRVTVFLPAAARDTRPVLLIATKKPYNEAKLLKGLDVGGNQGAVRVRNAVRLPHSVFDTLVMVDDRTLLFMSGTRDELTLPGLIGQLIAKKADGPLAAALADAAKHDIAIGIDARSVVPLLRIQGDKELAPYMSVFRAQTVTFTADFNKTAVGTLKLTFPDADAAKRAAPVLKEGMSEIAEKMGKELAERKEKMDPTERATLETLVAVLKAAMVDADGATVVATADLPHADTVAKFAAALPKSYTATVNSTRGQNNLKQLALGMHNYESAFATFPGDVYPGAQNPAWSWRVQLLPFIEQDNLYKQLDFTKAWDDPANLKKLEAMEMPKVFEIPGRPAPKGHTYFRVFTLPKDAKGTERPWMVEGKRGPRVADITDGLSNTVVIVEAGQAVPWYKPDVLAYDGKLPLPPLGDKDADRFIVAMGDGSVRVIRPSKVGEKTLRALITVQNGEVITLP